MGGILIKIQYTWIMNNTNSVMVELLKEFTPHINYDDYEIVNFREVQNESKRSDFYPRRMIITLEEMKNPPDDSWTRYVHDFKKSEVNDWPIRWKAVTFVIKKRRRKNKHTWETVVSKKDAIKLLEWTRRPEDHLTFLKYSDRQEYTHCEILE